MIEYFFVVSALVGLSQVIEGALLWRANGLLSKSSAVLSAIELGWFVECVYIVYQGVLPAPTWALPVAYITFNIIGWTFGVLRLRREDQEAAEIQLTRREILAPLIFGAIYMGANLWVWLGS